MKKDPTESQIREYVERALGEGWELARAVNRNDRGNIVEDGRCCILGAIAICLGANPDDDDTTLRGIVRSVSDDDDFRGGLEAGFEGWTRAYAHRLDAYDIGANIRRIYCDDNGEVE